MKSFKLSTILSVQLPFWFLAFGFFMDGLETMITHKIYKDMVTPSSIIYTQLNQICKKLDIEEAQPLLHFTMRITPGLKPLHIESETRTL